MKSVKRLLVAVLCSILIMGNGIPVLADYGPGTPSAWAQESVQSALNKGFVPYFLQDNYKAVITRAEFCGLAVRYMEYVTGQNIDAILEERGLACNSNAFSDTIDPNILAAYALGITSGTVAPSTSAPGLFTPRGQISREQAAVMIRTVCKTIGADVNNAPDAGYTDIGNASNWAVESINFCYTNRIMTGTSTSPLTFSPKTTYTREQSIVTFNNIENTDIFEQAGIIMVPGLENTQAWGAGNWARVSSVQQFPYKNEGIAYGYVMDNALKIIAPGKKLDIEMKYPELGDVISDDGGNFYVVWGRTNETDDASIETTFISKYNSDGRHVKTTGFVGESSPWGNSDSAKTKTPFYAGNCVSAIADGVLVNYHGKERYDGHQSDNVIAVKTSDMSVYSLPNNTYSGHSFNQSIIYCEKTSDFLFASQGDAYARGFRINNSSGFYGDNDEILFHFYLEANANYNMRIVNNTFAQLGGLAETSKGVALVGAAVKSIGEAAKDEKQNLFIQIFNPRRNKISSSMFIGGTTRSGATSFDINDNNNNPLMPVTDYGIHWLTNYTDTDVIAPQVVAADDQIIILWATKGDTLYMVLSASGDVLTPATSLGGLPLNSFEQPVYHKGTVYWVAIVNGRLKVISIEI